MNWWRLSRRNPSAVLLVVQLSGLLVYPFTDDTPAGRSLFSAFGIVVLALAVWSVRASAALTWVSLLLAAPATVLLIVQVVTDAPELFAWSSALEAGLYFYAAGALIHYMLADHRITTDEIYAVGATFTLVAWAFAYVYVVCQAVVPGSFAAAGDPEQQRSWIELLYLSFTTLSSTGLSDIGPALPFARSLVMLEQLAGVGYIAMVVSRLVGLLVIRRQTVD